MLRLLTEWNDAPGVRDPVLAATWARLEIKHESASGSQWLSRLIRSTANSLDRGVYGSLFPLAEWIVENWWFLLHESCRVPEFTTGRRLAGHSDDSTHSLRNHWKAVCESRHNESALCSWSAALGLDPYDEAELTDDLVEVMDSRLSGLQPELQHDLLDATTGSSLASDLDWLD